MPTLPTTEEALKPCPFCGSPAKVERGAGRETYVSCSRETCAAEDLCCPSDDAWNRRVIEHSASPQVTEAKRDEIASRVRMTIEQRMGIIIPFDVLRAALEAALSHLRSKT